MSSYLTEIVTGFRKSPSGTITDKWRKATFTHASPRLHGVPETAITVVLQDGSSLPDNNDVLITGRHGSQSVRILASELPRLITMLSEAREISRTKVNTDAMLPDPDSESA